MTSTVITALVSFASTNIDDIFVLMLFFSQTNQVMKKRHIVLGQFLGIGALTIISIIGALGVSVMPREYVGLLGFVPIFLGVKAYTDYKKGNNGNRDTDQNEKAIDQHNTVDQSAEIRGNGMAYFLKSFFSLSVLKVFSVTFANGGDNIGIYIPVFARMKVMEMGITVMIFMLLTALWCVIGIRLAKQPFVKTNIEKYKHILVPIIFIGLGIFILTESGTMGLFGK